MRRLDSALDRLSDSSPRFDGIKADRVRIFGESKVRRSKAESSLRTPKASLRLAQANCLTPQRIRSPIVTAQRASSLQDGPRPGETNGPQDSNVRPHRSQIARQTIIEAKRESLLRIGSSDRQQHPLDAAEEIARTAMHESR